MNFATLPVPTIAPGGYANIEEIARWISQTRAPVGFGQLLARYAEDFNVRWDVCLAIACKETGKFKYGGTETGFSVDPSFHNFGGLKTTDSTGSQRFSTDAAGVLGLVAHVAWYAHKQHVDARCNIATDPRHFASGHQGTLRTPADFGSGNGVWNPGSSTYAPSIITLLGEIWALA